MNSIWIIALAAIPSFLFGYGLRRSRLILEDKANFAKAEASIKAEQMEATVTASLDGIIIIDLEGNIVEFSASAERIFGYNKAEVIGKNMATIIVPERYREAHNKGMERMRATGKANILGQRIEIEAMRANGEEFMTELAISRSRSSSGDIFIAYLRDISESKAAEKALLDAKEAAELANRAKTQFISAMSHEIRTPFNAVLGIFDILGESKLTTDQKQLIETAERTSRSLLRIINDVLDYARISSGSVKVLNEAFHAPDVFDDVYRLFAMQAKDRNVVLSVNETNAKDIDLLGDIGRIRQILMNFVSNAIKYTRDGHVEMIIETEMVENGKWNLICEVKDDGQGIRVDKIDHLFEEFYMAEEVDTRASEGTGLGLTICKVLSKMMGGEIGVESELGVGSTFWVNIPLEQAKETKQLVEVPQLEASIEGRSILLVEDNPTNLMVVSRLLEKRGAILTMATNGLEALASLDSCAYDLLLTDVFMPEMGGKELVQRMRAGETVNAKIPVIALTAMGDEHEAAELKTYGVDQVILKPFNAKDLVNAIAQQCSKIEEEVEIKSHEMHKIELSGGLLDGLDSEDLQIIKKQFSIDLKDTTDQLRHAIKQRDVKTCKFSSHTLKGLAGLYGLSELSQTAALTNSNCSHDTLAKMVEHGTRAIKIADVALLSLDDLFGDNEEAA